MYPVKLYNGNSVLIYQVDNGADNGGRLPSGGVLTTATLASSMSATVANPITYYWSGGAVINQVGQSGDLYNYYWTSHSRGSDGGRKSEGNNPSWHNLYLDSYIPLRHKSIYDPCPYGYRIPSNGTYNQFNSNPGWTYGSYVGGVIWNQSWIGGSGDRSGVYIYQGCILWYSVSTTSSNRSLPMFTLYSSGAISYNGGDCHEHSRGVSVRCIEECELRLGYETQ